MNDLKLIKESFENWYNKHVSTESKVSIVLNYRDVQTLSIKAYHTITMEMTAIGIRENEPFTIPIVTLTENYNHGTTSEEEAKEGLTKKLLEHLYSF